ncbi:MAG: 23S rRNA pseudouridine(1911/1915/1917) synthase RluD [Cellvibrionales bacterium TMED148]|nr:23S rRNA pseudouridine(1911/1915/1917) synthase RluD [Porticoccaceae bacterium]RPG88794.1 MAG: 23S rRNA pseudouridine(1911/1915/1917) synthase RluD [Cellvibrionales bacterium TMED148]
MMEYINLHSEVGEQYRKHRFDLVAAALFNNFSRSQLQKWIKSGELRVDGEVRPADYRLKGGETISMYVERMPEGDWLAQQIPIEVVYEDDYLIVLNKPKDLVVHPAPGNWDATLLNGLLFQWPQLRALPRAGIVHRLDKDTTGLMVVAKNLLAYSFLVDQLQARLVKREYESIVYGRVEKSGTINAPIGRHPKIRTKMAVIDHGKEAVTHFRAINYFGGFTHVRLQLETGRTHQLRVHMAHIKHPIVGDPAYGRTAPVVKQTNHIYATISCFPRQALHAITLGLNHPQSGLAMEWTAQLPEDMFELVRVIQSGGDND